LRTDNPYYAADRKATKRIVRAGAYALLWALFFGFIYAQIARGAGLPSGLIGATAIIAQILTYFCALALQIGRFWK
jgi:hypothetical protein